MPLSLFLLGPPRVEIDGEAVSFPRQKSLALLFYLAVTGEQQRRDSLAALLWPESSDARGALRRELSSLRAALGDGDWLDADRESVSLAGDVRLDVEQFLAAVKSDDPARLAQAAELHRDDFLTGFTLTDAPDFDDWRFFASEEYRRTFAAALERLIAHHQSAGDPDPAIPYARRLLALDNLHEPSHRILMRLYALAGQHAAALRQYDECVRLLDEELGVPPEEETTELHEAIRTRRFPAEDDKVTGGQGDKVTSPPHPVTPSPGHNLPPQATPFVGRRREVEEVRSLLAEPTNRLVTITGVGGIGKSRLGLVVAETLRDAFADGVWFVPLAPLEAAEAVPGAIAAALSAPTGDGNSRALLLHFLRDKRLLLLLDNFEHLLEGADFLGELLHGAPGVKLLVTSQERLNLLEESLYPLHGLTVGALLAAPGGVAGAASSAPTNDAVHLFVERAHRVQPDFDPIAQNEAIGSICRLVEGMPLAIELAAGWVRVMSCTEIAAEIQRSADFLASHTRNLPARHRSLRAVFERSWNLLNTEQQSVLQRLSVFRGGFDRPAALAVADATPHVLMALLDHSFIRRQAGGRFDMHGLLQRFANEKLANESGAIDKSRQAHTDYYAELLNSMPWEYSRPEEVVGIWATRDDAHAYIALDFPNIQIAWRWAVQCEDVDNIRKMMNVLADCLQLTELMGIGSEILDSSIAAFESSDRLSEKTRADLLGQLLLKRALLMRHDELEARLQLLVRSLSLLRQNPGANPIAIAHVIQRRGSTLSDLGQKAAAEKDLHEALALFRAANHPTAVSRMILTFGHLQWGWGELKAATTSLREAAERFKNTDEEARHQAFQALAAVNLLQGNYAEAGHLLDRCAIYYRQLPHTHLWSTYIIQNYGELATATGRFADAERYFSEALEQFERIGKAWQNQLVGYLTPGVLLRLQGKLAESENYLENALLTARQVGWQQMEPFVLHHLSRVLVEKGEFHAGLQLAEEALSTSQSISQRFSASAALCQKGHCHIALKQADAARVAYAQAIDIADTEGIDRLICDALIGIVQLLLWRGDSQLALSLLHFAHTFEASEWETKRRAERLLADLPQTETHTPLPSLEEAIRLARAVLGDKVTSPSHPVTPSPDHNLPPQATPFVGRRREVEAVRSLLAEPLNRLVTITGVGGIGKSRLGLAVADALLGAFPDGVWFVPLAALDSAEAVPRAIAAALSAPIGDGNGRALLLHFLREKQLLLLLDNFEHLLEGADFLAELLHGAPGVRLLVTSQERLNLLEESLYPLQGLTVGALLAAPAPSAQGAASSAPTSDAVRLFVERAQRVQPDFDPAAQSEAIGSICRTVEGMPLAIELAAGWVRVMSCAEIAAEIQRSADFLASDTRNLPARHRSLRAVFERSWALLDPEEQTLLARLSVFQGGFTRQAAVTVADAEASATPRRLAGLVDHSFLRRQAEDRFDMHGLLHGFAAEQLAADPAVEREARRRHADFYAELVAQAGWELEPGDPAADKAAERDGPNVLAAWRWGVEQRDASVVERMMRWLVDYFRRRADYPSGEAAFTSAIEAFRSVENVTANPGLVGALLLRLAKCIPRHRFKLRPAVMQESVALLRQAQPPQRLDLAQALVWEGMVHGSEGRNPNGVVLMEEGIALFRAIGNELGVGTSLRDLGILHKGWGRPRESQARLEEAVQILTSAKLLPYVQSTVWLGGTLMMRGHYRRGEALLQRALPFAQQLSHNVLIGNTFLSLGELYTAIGDFGRAKRHFADARTGFEAAGTGYLATFGICHTPADLSRLADDADAESQLLGAVALTRKVGFEQRLATSLHHLARLRHDQRDYEGALDLLDEALTLARKIDFRYATALALTAQGHSLVALKQTDAARAAYREALEIADAEGIDRIACDALTGVAQLAHLRGDGPLALSLLHFAHTHDASEWETKRRAERMLADLPQTETHTQIPSLEEATRLARAVLGDTVTSPPHPATPSPGHLPTPATSFIGRESELSELSALLSRADVRLATVVAPGGMGKTRLAIEAARRLARDFPDGVWFASLVGVNESSQMLAALVQLLGAPMGAGDAADALLRFFARRRLLLVLDNFEQLAESAPVLAELLAGGPDVKLLVTSRARLNLREEWVFPLGGLDEAIRLFVERARQVQPDFDAEAESEAVAAICREVEGMPLAIELAASWLRAMNCGEIAAEIRRDVDFLSTSLRNVPEQHRSMRAVFERSWGLLTPDEQRGLSRLSVFQGGFTRAAAEAVAEVRLPLLSALVDQSLLRHSASGRYDIHELLRQFAAEQLGERASAEAVRDRHAEYHLEFLTAHTDDIQWRNPYETVARLLPDRENILAGWRWAVQRDWFELIRPAAEAYMVFSLHINALAVAVNAFQRALTQTEAAPELTADERHDLLGRLLWRLVCLETLHRDTTDRLVQLRTAREHLQQSATDNQEEVAIVNVYLAMALATLGRNDEGAVLIDQAVAVFSSLDNAPRLGWAYSYYSFLELGRGRPIPAHRWLDLSFDTWRNGGIRGESFLSQLLLFSLEGAFEQMYEAGQNALRGLPDPFRYDNGTGYGQGTILAMLGEWAILTGNLEQAESYYQQANTILLEEGHPWQIAFSWRSSLAAVYRLQHKWELARAESKSLIESVRAAGFQQRIVARLIELGQLEFDLRNYTEAEKVLGEAAAIAHSIDFLFFEALSHCHLGHTAAAQRKQEAVGHYRQALELTASGGMNPIVLDVLKGVARLRTAAGDVTQAVEWLALAAAHPNAEWETKQKAQKALAQLEERLSAEEFHSAQERGRGAELGAAVRDVREWLAVGDA